jgi:hypothetical protein
MYDSSLDVIDGDELALVPTNGPLPALIANSCRARSAWRRDWWPRAGVLHLQFAFTTLLIDENERRRVG